MDTTTDVSGTYLGIAGLVVAGLANFGIVTNAGDVASIIGAVVIIVGIVKQYLAHRKLAASVAKA